MPPVPCGCCCCCSCWPLLLPAAAAAAAAAAGCCCRLLLLLLLLLALVPQVVGVSAGGIALLSAGDGWHCYCHAALPSMLPDAAASVGSG
jgi:hypothetical protein